MSDTARHRLPRLVPAGAPAGPEVDRRVWTAWAPPVQQRLAAVRSELEDLAAAREVRALTASQERYQQHLIVREQELLEEMAKPNR
ncbi:MAG: hypothetical protein JF603_05740 [Acidobacteria bacterium]|nr:hypothetical protein [Acidobacteriota bacterium]